MHVSSYLYMQIMEALSQRVRDDSPDSKMNGESSTYYDASETRRRL